MEAKDFVGNPLSIGDKVVYMRTGYRCLCVGWIMSITTCMVYISVTGNEDRDTWTKQTHNQVIKYEK